MRETDGRRGEIVTFYSFKGGTGRTMALSNVAWILAAAGNRVLVADWDLESPGLPGFFAPFADANKLAIVGGVIDMIREFDLATHAGVTYEPAWYADYAQVSRYTIPVGWSFSGTGSLHLLSAGRQNHDYATHLADLDWEEFYEQRHGARFFDALRDDMKREFDYVLVDSRSGRNEVADICTAHLPDTVVNCFTLTGQAINGAAVLAHEISTRYANRAIRILPVPMRVDLTLPTQAEAGRTMAMRRLAGLPANMTDTQRRRYWAAVEVPYQAIYAFEETLAAIADPPGMPNTLLAAYRELAVHLSHGALAAEPIMDEGLRRRTAARFVRTPDPAISEVTLQYASVDAAWAEWIASVCRGAGLAVVDPGSGQRSPASAQGQRLILVSESNAESVARTTRDERTVAGGQPLAVYLADVAPIPAIDEAHSVSLVGTDVVTATTGLLRLLGNAGSVLDGPTASVRFPGRPPMVFQVPAQNPYFTGREAELRQLRARLHDRDDAAVLPTGSRVAVQGMGGIGKTQVAIEYAHRYASAYDLVWWIDATADLTAQLAALAPHLAISAQSRKDSLISVTLGALGGGKMYRHWLVVIDGADDLDAVASVLPRGTGHVVVTSRNPAWAEYAEPLEIGLFRRTESIAHLRQRLSTIRDSEAAQVAARVADLPVAVAAAGSWLAVNGKKPADFLADPAWLADGLQATWNAALDQLRESSPAAYRLLEVCAVLAPEIPLHIMYSDALSPALADLDPTVTGRWMRGKLVQAINRLALLQLDVRSEEAGGSRVMVHPILQQAIRSRMTDKEQLAVRHHAHVALIAARPRSEVDDPRSWAEYGALWPHLDASGAAECDDHSVRQLLISRLRYLWLRGEIAEGHALGRYLDAMWTKTYESTLDLGPRGELRRQILHLRFHLGNLRRDASDFAGALSEDQAVHHEQQDIHGPSHPYTLMTAGSIGADLRALGRYRAALICDRDTYDAWLDQFGSDHPRTLTAAHNLASSYSMLGDFRTAMRLDEHVYTRRKLVEGEVHPYTLLSGVSLGRDLRDAGQYKASLTLLRSVTSALAEQLGRDSRRTLAAQANLAVSLRVAGHPAEAAEMLHEAYAGLRDTAGPDSPDTPLVRLSYGLALRAVRRGEEAARELAAAYATFLARHGPEHPYTLAASVDLALSEVDQGDSGSFLRRTRDAVAGLTAVVGPSHPHTLGASNNLAVGLARQGDPQAASAIVSEVLERSRELLGRDHPDTLRIAANAALLARGVDPKSRVDSEPEVAGRLAQALGQAHPALVAFRERRFLYRVLDVHPF